ncbi:PaaI family thioesterase [Nocardioides dubius]|uniref:Acyl-coenzyme A thioesterase THEM4 n=1 Tax=Nocardioides dubius TaxID=317019 RepID=A0ABP4E8C1_9ACTN
MTSTQQADAGRTSELPKWARGNSHRGGPGFGELIEQVRSVMDASRFIAPGDDVARELTADLSRIVERMQAIAVPVDDAAADSREDLPARGNPSLPPFEIIDLGSEGVVAEIVFRAFHLGRLSAHGGNISLLFDELAGYATMHRVTSGFARTAFLKVDYRSLTPIDRPLRARVWVEEIDGRKLHVLGTLHDGDRLCADMTALFIQVPDA